MDLIGIPGDKLGGMAVKKYYLKWLEVRKIEEIMTTKRALIDTVEIEKSLYTMDSF